MWCVPTLTGHSAARLGAHHEFCSVEVDARRSRRPLWGRQCRASRLGFKLKRHAPEHLSDTHAQASKKKKRENLYLITCVFLFVKETNGSVFSFWILAIFLRVA